MLSTVSMFLKFESPQGCKMFSLGSVCVIFCSADLTTNGHKVHYNTLEKTTKKFSET
jgi:formate/nitrite transporter FocA (FNT family)